MAAEILLKVRVDRSELRLLESDIRKDKTIKVKATSTGVKETADNVEQLGDKAKKAESEVQSLGDMLAKKIAWYAISQSVVAVVNSFKEALNTIKEVDSQLATIKKVTDFSDAQMKVIKDSAYDVASAYGVVAQAYLESVGTFAKAGYKEVATDLGELATKTQLVGDVNSSIANQFLLSVDAAWKYHGSIQELSKVLDEANEVENNYATSIEKIAVGMPNVASIASMVGMSVEETIAALGTITAVTQQTGPKASTALRALILNLTGDINGMFEDEAGQLVSWTDEELGIMQRFLHKYAGDVMDAAKASGKLLNPIEAIRSLGQALERGEVSARDMYTQLSALGGKLRTNQLVALVENYRMMDDMLVKMGDSSGSATKEIDVMLDTWEAKTNILKNTFAEFVEKNVNTDAIKTFIDKITGMVQTLSTLDHPILMAGAAISALVAPTIIQSVKQLGTAFIDVKKAMSGIEVKDFAKSAATAFQTVATIAITAGFLIYNKYQEHLRELRADAQAAVDEAQKDASEAIADAENIQDLYDAFDAAKKAYNGTEESKQAYIDSAQALKTALGEEALAIDTTRMSLGELSDAFKDATGSKIEFAVGEAQESANAAQRNVLTFADTNKNSKNPILRAGAEWTDKYIDGNGIFGARTINVHHSEQERYARMIEEYARQKQLLRDANKKYQEDATKENREEIQKIEGYINEVKDVMDQSFEARMALAIAEANLEAFRSGKTRTNANGEQEFVDEQDAIAKAAEEAAAKLQNFSNVFDAITDSANGATKAIEAFQEATSTDVTDNADAMATAYENYYKAKKEGNIGSTSVSGATDLLLSQDMINSLQGDIGKLAEYLGGDFFKKLFIKGIDDNKEEIFATGEELGQRFANIFKEDIANGVDEAGNAVLKYGDITVATLEETKDGLVMNVNDIDMLSDAMNGLDPDAILMLLDSMSIKTGVSLKPTIDEILELANEADAVHEKINGLQEIDLARIVENAFALGKSDTDVWKLVNALKEANENGDIDLVIDWAEVDVADEKTRDLINSLEKAGIPITTYVNVSHIDEAKQEVNEYKKYLDSIPRTLETRIYAVKDAKVADRLASGTESAKGGATLVNEEGAEIIQEGDRARIAGNGYPTITDIAPGATVWNAEETKEILRNRDASILFDGINAFAGGTRIPASIKNITHNAGKGVKISSTNSDKTLEWHQDYVELRKAEYDLAEARGASAEELFRKERQIQSAIRGQIEYLQKIKGSQTEIDQLATEWYQINKKIKETTEQINKELYDQLSASIKNRIDVLDKERDKEKEAIQKQIDSLKEKNEKEKKSVELAEKKLAVDEAEERLQNAQNQRNVRYYNASTGQWEFRANANEVKSAQESLDDAKQYLKDYTDDQELQKKISDLEKQQAKVDKKYDKQIDSLQKVLDSLAEPVMSILSAVKNIENNATKDQASTIKSLSSLLVKALGKKYKISTKNLYDDGGVLKGIGGIKGTQDDEVVLPPDITRNMLKPIATATLASRMNELRYLYGVTGGIAGITNSQSIGSQHNGDLYTIGNVTLTEGQARSTTVYDLVQMTRGLRAYNAM